MRRANAFLLSSIYPLNNGYPESLHFFAGLYALVPRVLKSAVTGIPAVLKPGTAGGTATRFPRFCNGAAFGTYRTGGRRRGCWCFHAGIGQ